MHPLPHHCTAHAAQIMRPYLQRQVLYQSVSLRFARWASIWQVENLGSITLLIAPFCLSFASLNLCNHYRALNFIQNFCQCRSRRSHNYIFLSIVPMMWIIRQIQFPVMACIIITKNQRTIIPNILVNIHQTICTNFVLGSRMLYRLTQSAPEDGRRQNQVQRTKERASHLEGPGVRCTCKVRCT